MMSKKFVAEKARSLERILVELTSDEANFFDWLKISLQDSTYGANCAVMLSKQLVSVRDASSKNPSASASGSTTFSASTAPSTSAGNRAKDMAK